MPVSSLHPSVEGLQEWIGCKASHSTEKPKSRPISINPLSWVDNKISAYRIDFDIYDAEPYTASDLTHAIQRYESLEHWEKVDDAKNFQNSTQMFQDKLSNFSNEAELDEYKIVEFVKAGKSKNRTKFDYREKVRTLIKDKKLLPRLNENVEKFVQERLKNGMDWSGAERFKNGQEYRKVLAVPSWIFEKYNNLDKYDAAWYNLVKEDLNVGGVVTENRSELSLEDDASKKEVELAFVSGAGSNAEIQQGFYEYR